MLTNFKTQSPECPVHFLPVLIFGLTVFVGSNLLAQSAPGDVVGKITVGYQGWFSAQGDNSPEDKWQHQNLEMWPDIREYTTTYQTKLPNLGNGQPARMFSSYDDQVVQTHFKWMAQSEIDCAALQRFASEIEPGTTSKAQRDGMALKVMHAAETSNLKFYIMYDASGWGVRGIKADWSDTIVHQLRLTASRAYARQNEKPVVCIYGVGYKGWPATAEDALDLINWFKQQGCYVIGSLPGAWRTGNGDSRADFQSVYTAFNMISAWAVGRRMDQNYEPWIAGDCAYCKSHGIDYQPCAYPGTSFFNSNQSGKNLIPRNHGDFMWSQFVTMRQTGVQSVYIAMFDEMNEATSIFKCAEDKSMIPAGEWFLPLDADGIHVSSDFYLRLTRDAGRMIKGRSSVQRNCPTPFTLSIQPSTRP
jgi:hypothetical protein